MKTIIQKSIEDGINLRGTRFAGSSAEDLRRDNPALAGKWARFVKTHKRRLVSEISGKLCAS